MDNRNFAVQTSTDTGFLKIIAFITMLIDHIGFIFFPSEMWLRLIGRIAFPLFAYSLALGFLYTKSVKKYALRLLAFALISQPFYSLAFYFEETKLLFNPALYTGFASVFANISDYLALNIGFTLLLGLWALYGIREKKYLHTAAALLISLLPVFEYSVYGVSMIAVFYIFITKPKGCFAAAAALFLFLPFVTSRGFYDFFGLTVDPQGFALLALPFILINTDTKIKIPRFINYGFYPIHLGILYLINLFFR